MHALNSVLGYMLMGLKFLVPILFLLQIDKLRPVFLNKDALIVSFNITLLSVSIVFIAGYVAEFFEEYYSGVENEQYALINRATGPYWFSFWIPISICTLLPQLIWFKKIRDSVKITYTWFGLALALSVYIKAVYIIVWTHRDYLRTNFGSIWTNYNIFPPLSECALSLLVTIFIITILYFALLKIRTIKSVTNF